MTILSTSPPAPLRPTAADDVPARLEAVRTALLTRRSEVFDILTQVSTARAVDYEIDAAVRALAGAVEEVERHRPPRVPSAAVFMPSNVLLYSYVLYLLIPSLYVDRSVFRPSSQVKAQMTALHEMLAPVHGLDVTLSTKSQRAFLKEDVSPSDVVVFTGTYQNAEQIRGQLRRDQLFVFLGSGINPVVVAPGADVIAAVAEIVDIRLLNSGQDCLAPDIIWVHASLADTFVDVLRTRLAQLRHGPHNRRDSDYGSLTYESALRGSLDYLVRHRSIICHGGDINLATGHLRPTVMLWSNPAEAEIQEFFAPVFNVCVFDDEAQAAATFATGLYHERALGATVFGHAPAIVEALGRRHTLTIDRSLLAIDDGNMPFGGHGPMANYVSVDGRIHAEPILLSKAVAEHWVVRESLQDAG